MDETATLAIEGEEETALKETATPAIQTVYYYSSDDEIQDKATPILSVVEQPALRVNNINVASSESILVHYYSSDEEMTDTNSIYDRKVNLIAEQQAEKLRLIAEREVKERQESLDAEVLASTSGKRKLGNN